MTPSEQFLRRIVTDSAVQQAIISLNFDQLQTTAAHYGYTINEIEMNAVLTQSPDLVMALQALISASELEFELDEAEMALIAGGSGIDIANSTKVHAAFPSIKVV